MTRVLGVSLLLISLVSLTSAQSHEPEKAYPFAPSATISDRQHPQEATQNTCDEPLSSGGKFKLFVRSNVWPSNFLRATASAGFGQAIDSPGGYGQGGDGYAKRFGASMATGASNSFFGTFLIPSLLHHDPRFFPEGDGSFRQNLRYSLRRIVVTRTDSGDEAFNWSGVLSPVLAQSVANSYLPDHERTVGKTFMRSGQTIGTTAAMNFFKEYWPTISRKLKRNKAHRNDGLVGP